METPAGRPMCEISAGRPVLYVIIRFAIISAPVGVIR